MKNINIRTITQTDNKITVCYKENNKTKKTIIKKKNTIENSATA